MFRIKSFLSATGFMIVGAVSFLLISCGGEEVSATSNAGIESIPKECSIVAKANIKKIMNLESVKKALKKGKEDSEYKKMVEAGLDPEKMVSAYIGIKVPESGKMQKDGDFILFIEMSQPIELQSMLDYVKKESKKDLKFTDKSIGDFSVKVFTNEADGRKGGVFQLNDKTLAVGSIAMVEKSIDVLSGKAENVTANTELMSVCDKSKGGSMFWIAGQVPEGVLKKQNPKAPDLRDFFLFVNKTENLNIGGAAAFGSEQDAMKATQQFTMMAGFMAMGAKGAIKQEDIKIEAKGKKMIVDINISEEAIKKITEKPKGPKPGVPGGQPGQKIPPQMPPQQPANK